MNIAWTKHIKTTKEKEDFEKEILGSKRVLKRLRDLAAEKLASLETLEYSISTYDNPNWEHRQAHINGSKDCLRYFDKLLNLDQQEK